MLKKLVFILVCFVQTLNVVGATLEVPIYGITSAIPSGEEIPPFGKKVVGFEPHEQKTFQFGRGTITFINDRKEFVWLLTFIDEGAPVFAIIKSFGEYFSWGVHYGCQIPREGENVIVIIDESWK